MKLHANAALRLNGRRRMAACVVEQGWSITEAALAAGVSGRTCSKWVGHYRAEGEPGLLDRSSAPRRVHNRTDEGTVQLLAALRRLRFTAPELGELLGLPISTVSGILGRIAMGKLGRLGLEPARRYARERPGELIHIDVKKLGRIKGWPASTSRVSPATNATRTDAARVRRHTIGWDAVHVAVDDATRLAYVEVLPDEKALTVVGFLRRAVKHFERYGITVERVITETARPTSRPTPRSPAKTLGIRHLRTHTYRPQTNGKAERFIRTMLGGWADGAIYASSTERTAALDGWLWQYNHHRRHQAPRPIDTHQQAEQPARDLQLAIHKSQLGHCGLHRGV